MKRLPPLIFGHRGDPVHAPENTLESFKSALDRGAQGIEADIRRCADGVWVVFHDAALKRTTGRSGQLAKTKWATVRRLGIPSLREALALCRRRRAQLFLDLKVSGQEEKLFRLLQSSGGLSGVQVGVGKVFTSLRWRRLMPKGSLFWVTGYRMPLTQRRIALARRLRLTGFVSYKKWVDPVSLGRVHEAGLKLYVWTVKHPRELRRFRRVGVDGIMSEVWPHHLIRAPKGLGKHTRLLPAMHPPRNVADHQVVGWPAPRVLR